MEKVMNTECLYGTIALRYYEYCYSILSFRTCNDANQIIYIIESRDTLYPTTVWKNEKFTVHSPYLSLECSSLLVNWDHWVMY